MDLYKRINIVKATAEDLNAPHVVILRDRKKVAKRLSRYSRRKLKLELELKEEDFKMYYMGEWNI